MNDIRKKNQKKICKKIDKNNIECNAKTSILDPESFVHVCSAFKWSINYVTLDIKKEDSNQIIYAQICYALCVQKTKGNFILKFLDTFSREAIDIIGLLSSMYGEVSIANPLSCENYHSESYIVCKNFLPDCSENFHPYLSDYFTKVLNMNKTLNNFTFFNNSSCISEYFSNKVKEYSTIFTQYQIEHIHNTLNLISTDRNKKVYIHSNLITDEENADCGFIKQSFEKSKVQYLLNVNVNKCIQFCKSHQIEINKVLMDRTTQ